MAWFIILLMMSTLALVAGGVAGRRSLRIWGVSGGICIFVLVAWVYLYHHPTLALRCIPIQWLVHLEGAAAAPFFLMLMGIAWSRACRARQKKVVAAGVLMGLYYLLHGSLWMLQSAPTNELSRMVPQDGLFEQSQDYTCVPASCATALGRLGVPSTEAQMAELTHTRAGYGTTMLRAMGGLCERLRGMPVRANLLEVSFDELRRMPPPVLTAFQYERGRQHMITFLSFTQSGAVIMDPMIGEYYTTNEDIQGRYRGWAIAFDWTGPGARPVRDNRMETYIKAWESRRLTASAEMNTAGMELAAVQR